jgi:hypothetical protein
VGISFVLACVGAGISLYGALQYFLGILRGDTRPRLASWIAWLSANSVFTAVAFFEHAYLAAIINGLAAAANAAILIVSLARRQGQRPTGMTDWSCLTAASACLLMQVAFPKYQLLGAILAMVANATATWPTIVHAWHRPKEESWQFFMANIAAGGLSSAGIALTSGFGLVALAGPMMTVIGNVVMTSITVGRSWVMRAEEEVIEEIHKVEDLFERPSSTMDDLSE